MSLSAYYFIFGTLEMTGLQERLSELQSENVSLQTHVKNQESVCKSLALTAQQLQDSRDTQNELKSRCHQQQKMILGKRDLCLCELCPTTQL